MSTINSRPVKHTKASEEITMSLSKSEGQIDADVMRDLERKWQGKIAADLVQTEACKQGMLKIAPMMKKAIEANERFVDYIKKRYPHAISNNGDIKWNKLQNLAAEWTNGSAKDVENWTILEWSERLEAKEAEELRHSMAIGVLSRDVGTDSDSLVREAARRLVTAVADWRAELINSRGGFVLSVESSRDPKRGVRIDPGPRFNDEDLDLLASTGPLAATSADSLRVWGRTDGEGTLAEPSAALGYVRAVAEHGEAVALKRWSTHVALPLAVVTDGFSTDVISEHRTPTERAVDKIMVEGFKCPPRNDDAKKRPHRDHLATVIVSKLKAVGVSSTVQTVKKALTGWDWRESVLADELTRDGHPCGRRVWNIAAKRE